jgi:predicted Rossmann fold flavoprotein
MNIYDVIIVGGGASGIMAALSANENGNQNILILEKNNRIGKKILVTGNGRCNYTNVTMTSSDYIHPEFVEKVFNQFGFSDTIDFFDNLGIIAKVEEEGKTYPLSEQASTFLDVFLFELNIRKIDVETEQTVISISKNREIFQVKTVEGRQFNSKNVIIATGGKSMSITGSDGSGFEIVEKLGHKTTNLFPALVKLRVESEHLKHLSGVKINTQVDLLLNDEIVQTENGDVLFANYGISGPTILEISRKANELLLERKKPELRVVLIQSISKARIIDRFQNSSEKEISQALIGIVNKRFISVLLKEAKIEKSNLLVKQLSKEQLFSLVNLLFDWRFKITGSLGFEDSQVTAGGVDINEVDAKTLQSKVISGLFFSGEVLDIDGRCGGFNLQWAWSSGYVAGKNASENL